MTDHRPLIVNPNAQQIQELTDADDLVLPNSTCTAESFIGNGTIPVGGIIMWSGAISAIPTGWSLCNGSNGTPDLRNKFVLGAWSDGASVAYPNVPPLGTGGTADAVVVSHTHSITDPGHTHTQDGGGTDDDGGGNVPGSTSSGTQSNINTATTGISIDTEGVSGTNQNLPPFLALAYIQRTS